MKHLGDITKISGFGVPPVDVVIGGSPCQNLSIAGKREGLAGEQSGLFLEQIRLIKEMRNADIQRGGTGQLIRPRFMVWENVPGAFSSNKGEDFRVVLEETIRIAEPDAPDIPLPPKGRWPLADAWYGDGWSVAYRVLDAQFWGVPQRRRRIALVADFGGHAAIEILFVRKGVCGDIAPGEAPGEETAAGTGGGTDKTIYCLATQQGGAEYRSDGKAPTLTAAAGMSGNNQPVICLNDQGGQAMSVTVDATGTLRAQEHGHQPIVAFTCNQRDEVRLLGEKAGALQAQAGMKQQTFLAAGFKHKAGAGAGSVGFQRETVPTLSTGQTSAVYIHQNQLGEVRTGEVAGTLNTNSNASGRNAPLIYDARGNGDGKIACTITGDHEGRITDYTAIVMAHGQSRAENLTDVCPTLNCNHEQPIVARPLTANHSPVREDMATYPITNGALRRLTPLECERIQGYPDGWTDIGPWVDSTGKRHKESSDAARYKALGNSIALPPWAWVLKRLCACYERPATMASLFDGIGGFPLLWERLNGPGTCLWASEIEEFPMAVTGRRFEDKQEVAKWIY